MLLAFLYINTPNSSIPSKILNQTKHTSIFTTFRPPQRNRTKSRKHHRRKMKLVWSPETASKAYIETVQSCQVLHESGVAELVSAMAAGWNAQLIVETWSEGGVIATSLGLAIARGHTGRRHVCVVPDERSKLDYGERMGEAGTSTEIMVGEAEEVMEGLVGIDFMVVDCKGREFSKVLRVAKLSAKGAVLVCKNADSRNAPGFKWRNVLDEEGSRRLFRSVFLPVGKGLDIAHVSAIGANKASALKAGQSRRKRWIKHVDQRSGEMHVIRR